MTARTYHDGIQNALVNLVKGRRFPKVTYPSGLRETAASPYTSTNSEVPKVRAHRVGAQFGESQIGRAMLGADGCNSNARSTLVAEMWLLELDFNGDASLTEFEAVISSAPLKVPVDPVGNPTGPHIWISLAQMEQGSPTEQNGTSGLRALYTLRVHWPGK